MITGKPDAAGWPSDITDGELGICKMAVDGANDVAIARIAKRPLEEVRATLDAFSIWSKTWNRSR